MSVIHLMDFQCRHGHKSVSKKTKLIDIRVGGTFDLGRITDGRQ